MSPLCLASEIKIYVTGGNMAHIKNVVQSTQHGDKMYTFVLDAPKLLALCQIERFGEGTDGVERKLDENHALEIAAAMLDADVVWREPICGDLRGNWVFENGQLSYKDGAYISVDDGQHRCRGLELLNARERAQMQFTVTTTQNLPFERRLKIFRMQKERKPIDSTLDLAQRNRLGQWKHPLDEEAYNVVLRLNSDPASPLRGCILLDEQIKRPHEGRHRPSGLNAKGLHMTVRRIIGGHSPLRALSPQGRSDAILAMINLMADIWQRQWRSEHHILTTARGINSVLALLISSPHFRGVVGEDFSQSSLRTGLELAGSFDWAVHKNRNDSVARITDRLNQSIGRKKFTSLKGNS